MKPDTSGYDELVARRSAEIDEVIEQIASFAGPRPTKVEVMFESLLLSYAALAARDGQPRTVLLGQEGYQRAKDSGLLAWCAEQYPGVTFEPPTRTMRGCRPSLVIIDEVVDFHG